MLTQKRILHYIPRKKTPYIIYTRERQEKKRLHLSKEVYEDRKESYVTRINAMIEYASAEENCRSRMLLRYFGEKNEHNCGLCDVCLQKHETGLKLGDFQRIKKEILEILSVHPCSIIELQNKLQTDHVLIEQTLSFLLAEEIIFFNDGILST